MSRTETRTGASTRAAHLGPAVRRPLVLDAALTVWDHAGYRGTTMAAIAAEAGVSKPVLYECFDNKDQVLVALLDREEERLMSGTQAALPVEITDDLQATVAESYTAFFKAVLAHPGSWRIVVDAQRAVPTVIGNRYRRGRAVIVDQIAVLVRMFAPNADQLSDAEAHVVASSIASLAEDNASLLLRQDPGPDAWTPEDLASFVAKVALGRWIG
jgi:AcrR family transcriptional regulator